jgi:F0F1-type ATP synthase gamma subunit
VKRKLEKGELVLLCIPNQNKDNIKKAGDDYFKQVTDLPAEKKAKNNHKVVKVNINEFTSLDVELFSDYTLNHRLKFPTYHSRYSRLNQLRLPIHQTRNSLPT